MTLPVGSIAMCTATIGHVNGPDHAPLSCAWLEATVKVVLVEVGPSVAVTFAACGVVTVPAVAVKVADVELAGTVTEAGTGSAGVLFDDSETVLPPVGADCVRFTVQMVDAPDVRVDGEHTRDETLGLPGVTVTVVLALPLSVAVTVTVCGVGTTPAVAVKVIDVAVAGTVTDAGTGSAATLFEDKVTVLPPAGAAWVSVTVHVVEVPDVRLAGAHASDDTLVLLEPTVKVAAAVPPSVAVTVTVCGEVTVGAVAVKVADPEPAGTVTDAGTGSAPGLFDASVTTLPPVGAACVRVTVQIVVPPETRLAGAHASDDTLGAPPPPPPADIGLKAAICAR
jgi:hypothetical protein